MHPYTSGDRTVVGLRQDKTCLPPLSAAFIFNTNVAKLDLCMSPLGRSFLRPKRFSFRLSSWPSRALPSLCCGFKLPADPRKRVPSFHTAPALHSVYGSRSSSISQSHFDLHGLLVLLPWNSISLTFVNTVSKMEPSPEPVRGYPPHHTTHVHQKNIKKGAERLDRRSGTGVSGIPKKSGHGGKFTWDGPSTPEDYTEDAVIALDEKDPNYVDEQREGEVRPTILDESKELAVVEPKVKEAVAS